MRVTLAFAACAVSTNDGARAIVEQVLRHAPADRTQLPAVRANRVVETSLDSISAGVDGMRAARAIVREFATVE